MQAANVGKIIKNLVRIGNKRNGIIKYGEI
jgi:hypothetical protein